MFALLPMLYFFSAFATLLFGVPAFYVLRRLKMIRWWSALLSGCAIGAIMAVVIRLPSLPMCDDIYIMSLAGAASGFVFWVIWRLGGESIKESNE